MTIQSQTTRVDYTGNGATTTFPVPFYWLQDTDLLVIRTDNAYTPPTVATLALGTDYVVTGSGNQSGGSITTTVAPTASQKLSILRSVPFTQLTHYVPNDPFPAASHEQALDKLTMETQQLNEGLSRSLTLPPNTTGVSTALPTPVASQLIGWNGNGTGLQNVDPSTLATIVAFGTASADLFSGDGTTKNFTLSKNPGALANLDVSIGGVTQRPGVDYTWDGTVTVSFATAPIAGTSNILIRYMQGLAQGSSDAGITTFSQSATYLPGTVGLALQGTVNAKNAPFNAKGDGVTDDTLAVQAALNAVAAVGGEVYLPNGTYKITSALVMDTGVYTRGVSLRGAGRNTIINQTGAGQDGLKFSTTQFLQNSWVRDLQIVCSATAGHCVNIVYGCTTCFFDNVELLQNNPAKSCMFGDYTSFGGGVYDTKFRGGNWYTSTSSTVPGVQFKANGTIFNENCFENLRWYNAANAPFFKIGMVAGSGWLINNTLKNINFEICKGGAIEVDSIKDCNFQSISFWDAGGTYNNDVVRMISGVGLESVANVFTNVGRHGDTLAGGKYDMTFLSGQDTVIVNCYTQTGDSPAYNFNNKRVTWIGKPFGTVVNTAGLTIINSIDGIRFPGTVNGASLNYYDEGTWTATLGGSTGNPTTPVTATGRWTRIGRIVKVDVNFLNVTTTGASGQVQVQGLPFAPVGVAAVGLVGLSGLGANAAIGIAAAGATTVGLVQQASIGANILYGAGSGQYVYLTMEYTV